MRKFLRMIWDEKRPVRERSFILLTGVALIALFLSFVGGFVIGESPADILVLGVGFIVFASLTYGALKFKMLESASVFASFLIIFGLLPLTFITGGGTGGGAPLWFIFCTLFISLLVEGKIRYILIILNCLMACACYALAYFHPEMITEHEGAIAYTDSLISLLFVSIMLSIMVRFEIRVMQREKELSEEKSREIEALNQAQSRFFSSLSHEIRTPINTIIGLNEMIIRENVSDEINEDAVNIKAASRMLLHLINEILDMSKFESGEMHVNPAPYHTGDMLSDVVGMVWLRAKEKKLDFRVDVSPDLPSELFGDEVRIKQILINILANAIKYTEKGSVRLQIQCEKKEDDIANMIYTISDTGMGIRKESLPYLFTAFKRMDEDKNKYIEGTGLGLAIVKQFVDLMDGKITVNSVYTKGSTFIVEIPQRIENDSVVGEINVEKRGKEQRESRHVTSFEAPRAKLLVVDDTESNLMVVEKLLRETKVIIETATSGRDALSMTLDSYYDVIFMDHMMPEMDGIECMHAIRKQTGGQCRDSKIVALTANAGSELNEMYEREGFDGYVVKPVTGVDLERELYRLLPKDMVIVTGTEEELAEESASWVVDRRKKRNVAVTTESVADLTREMLDEYGIETIPHVVMTEGGTFKDGTEIETRGVLAYMDSDATILSTRAPKVEELEAFFSEQLSNANNIIHITISGKVESSGYLPASEAASNFDNVFVVDSGHLSGGQGLMAIEAARLAEQGLGPEEIIEALNRMRDHIHTSFMVDDIDYLMRAGQVSKRTANLSKAFMLRPMLDLKKGRMRMPRMFIGSRESAWAQYLKTVFKVRGNIDRRMLMITYIGLTVNELQAIEEFIRKEQNFERIILQKGSPSISVNSGPGAFGLMFYTEY